jgi:hypothetical protein
MTQTTTWTCRVVNCGREAVAGWGDDLFPSIDVCSGHLDELARGALALHTNGGRNLLVKPLQKGTI